MPDMTSINHDIHFSLFKGVAGTRKSTAALSYPKPQYWFSYDRKMKALHIPMSKWKIDPKQIHYDDYTDWNSAVPKFNSFLTSCPYKTIVVDSFTSLADSMLRQVRNLKSGKTRASGQSAGREVGGIPVSELEDFNAEASGLTELIAQLKEIHQLKQVDIILIAHVISLDGQLNNGRSIVTAGKKIAAKIPAYCDETYQFDTETPMIKGEQGDYIVRTSAGEDYARTTLPLPNIIKMNDDPLYDRWILPAIKKIKGGDVSNQVTL